MRAGLNPRLELEGIVFTMVDARANLARQVMDEVRSHFGARVYETTVPRNVRLSEAPSHGKPVLLYDIRSRGARAATCALAAEFLKRTGARCERRAAASTDPHTAGARHPRCPPVVTPSAAVSAP